jgi:NAD(P)-dependent dehydrogenase (short-subunit alcohol dehydrogenase family)
LEGRDDLEQFRAERTARIPLARRTTPQEMAQAVAWLGEDVPDYMTAERLNLSGGLDKDWGHRATQPIGIRPQPRMRIL